MCGITAIYNKSSMPSASLSRANAIVAHRGPDDEGFLLWRPDPAWRMYAGNDSSEASRAYHHLTLMPDDDTAWQVGLGHRRLSILDLSPHGHQPMTLDGRFAITYNGEVYNYLEIRQELEALGHVFHTGSDTEVILHAWHEWGAEGLHRFNGMFAFVLLDTSKQKLYAVRDRFGVKPLYYTERPGYLAFASEVKQLRTLPEYQFVLNGATAYDYLAYGWVDHNVETFETGILQMPVGGILELDLQTGQQTLRKWYTLNPNPWKGSFEEASEVFYSLLKDSVRLRLRSDVPVGSALSGGLDSSTIVCLMREVLDEQGNSAHSIETVTSCQEDIKYDEWAYAEKVINRVKAKPYRVFPSFQKLVEDLDRLIWHLDYPFGSTSQFSQWCVFEKAAQAGLTVMIDGQGADEQLAGYGGNDLSLYTGLLKSGQWLEFWKEAAAYKNSNSDWPIGFILGALQYTVPASVIERLPDKYRVRKPQYPEWLRRPESARMSMPPTPGSLRENLLQQIMISPLPSLLRYEDRNSMAFSVESRVPFMDYRLIEFTLGLPERYIYKRGVRKHILRSAFADLVPKEILERRDKMGFVSPEERWMKEEGREWFEEEAKRSAWHLQAVGKRELAESHMSQIVNGDVPFNFLPWRIINFGYWLSGMNGKSRNE